VKKSRGKKKSGLLGLTVFRLDENLPDDIVHSGLDAGDAEVSGFNKLGDGLASSGDRAAGK